MVTKLIVVKEKITYDTAVLYTCFNVAAGKMFMYGKGFRSFKANFRR